jgi:hypothetical protein
VGAKNAKVGKEYPNPKIEPSKPQTHNQNQKTTKW